MRRLSWLWRDLRFGLRSLRKDPRFTSVAVLTLALGIAAATVIFSVLDSTIFEPFPFKDQGRLVTAYVHDPAQPKQDGSDWFSMPEFMDLREQNHVFEDMYAERGFDVLYSDGKQSLLFQGTRFSPNGFDFLGVNPLLGRPITEADANPGSPPVFAMSYRLWVKQFNQDPRILGTSMTLNGERKTLVAIMPPRFIPANGDIFLLVPWSHTDIINTQSGGFPLFLQVFERLKPGASLQSATTDVDVMARREATLYPKNFPKGFTIRTKYLGEALSGDFYKMLYLLLAASLLLLLIACSNVANLLLARATAREKEIAIRASVGASRSRLVLQLFVESSLLAAVGCLLGCAFAYGTLKYIAAVIPPGWFAYDAVIEMKPLALYFAMGVAMLTTVLSGLAPAIHAVRGKLASRLSDTGKGLSGSFRHGKLRASLVVFEVALSIVMLVGAGLMMRTLFALEHVDLGFNPKNILVARIAFPDGRYVTAQEKLAFFRPVLQRMAALPGVSFASVSTDFPPYGGAQSEITIPGKTHTERWMSGIELVSDGYLQTLGLRLLRGRTLSVADVDTARHVIVINQTLASNYFPGEDPIGKTIKFNFLDDKTDVPHDSYFDIIGIVQDSRNQGLRQSILPDAYTPYTITGRFYRYIYVRTMADPLLMLSTFRQVVSDADSNVALTYTGSLEGYLQQYSYAQPQFGLATMIAFASVGLLLVIIGVFSVMAYTVSLQTHDIGVRIALGAQPESIVRMVLKNGLTLVAAGIVIGLLASFVLMRFVANQFFGVSTADPWTLAAVIILIVIVGLAACLFPARRAMRVDPMVALRYE